MRVQSVNIAWIEISMNAYSSSSFAYKTRAILYKDKYNLALNYRHYETKISNVHSGNVTNPSVSFVAQRMRAFDLFNAVYVHKT